MKASKQTIDEYAKLALERGGKVKNHSVNVEEPPSKKKHKYGAVRTEIDGIAFASKKEASRYVELRLMQKNGMIRLLELQPEFPMIVNDIQIGVYRADFRYVDCIDGVIVEEVKGFKTPVYKLKKRIIEAQYGIKIKEI